MPILLAVRAVLNLDDSVKVVVFTVAIFAFFLLARLSNLLPVSTRAFRWTRDLCRRNILLIDDHLIVIFNCTKTIQFGEHRLKIPLVPFPGSSICPVEFYLRMIQLLPASSSSPAFVIPGCKGLQVLSKSYFIKLFRELLQRAGVPLANCYSGHSFRRGELHGRLVLECQGNSFRYWVIGNLNVIRDILNFH